MKKIVYPSIFILLTIIPILGSCSLNSHKSSIKVHTYEEVEEYHIPYKNLLKMEDFEYFAYIYSLNCLHCESIKFQVIDYALKRYTPIYFIKHNSDIPLLDDITVSINQNTLSSFGILGTPALIQVIDGYIKMNVSGSEIIVSILNASM